MAKIECQPLTLKELACGLFFFAGPTNVGVAARKDADGFTELYFVDAGEKEEDARKLWEECEKAFGKTRAKAIILTHAHADHIGGALWLKQKTSCEIWATLPEASCAQTPDIQAKAFYGAKPLPELDIPYFHAPQVFVDKIIEPGQKLDCGGLEFNFAGLPGHSFGMIGVLAAANGKKVFYAGDGIFGRSMLKRYWIPFVVDVGAFKESIERIGKIQADFFVPSHGEAYDEAETLAELNLISTLSNENLIEELLREPKTHEELLKAFCDKSGIKMKISQFMLIGSSLRSYLTYLYTEGRVKWSIQDNKMLWEATGN